MNLAGNERHICDALNWVDKETKDKLNIKLFPKETVVFAKVGAALLLNRRRVLVRETAIDNNMMGAIPSDKGDSLFLYYLLLNINFKDFVQEGAVPSVNQSQLSEIQATIPPFPEQQKIASILTSVDTVIEKTEAQINKLKELKQAMMQELLTKGIGHKEFKDSPVGRIPVGWKMILMSDSEIDVLDGDRGNEYPKANDFATEGFCLFLSAKNVTKNGFKFKECAFISKNKDSKLRKGRLVKDDIVITTRGTVGNMAHFDESVPYEVVRINSGMAILRNDDDLISTKYLFQLLNAPIIKKQLELLTFGSAQPQLTIGTINSLHIPIPPLAEQNMIASILASADSSIEGNQTKLSHTKSLKKALMQDLLTGKVRVAV